MNLEHPVILVSEFKMLPLFFSSFQPQPQFCTPPHTFFLFTHGHFQNVSIDPFFSPDASTIQNPRDPKPPRVNPTVRQEIQMIKQRYFFQLQSDNPTNPIDLSRLEIDLKNESSELMSSEAIS